MASSRSQRIRTNIQRVIDKSLRSEESTPSAVYDAINNIQDRIVEATLCLEGKEDIILYGQQFYGLPNGFITEKKIIGMERIDFDEVDRLIEQANSSDSTEPTYYYIHNNEIGFLTASGTYPASDTVTMYYYRQVGDSEKASDTVDPVVDKRWDRTLFYGAVCELIQDGAWEKKYEVEFERRAHRQVQNASTPGAIPYNNTYD